MCNVDYVLDMNSELQVSVERIGDWLWVSGDTKSIRDELKVLGFHWGSKKKAWYFKGRESKRGTHGFFPDMNTLRAFKGSERLR
jgi:hypothetical protein